MTTYAISDTSRSFIHMAQTLGISGSGGGADTGVKETLVVGDQAITSTLGNPSPNVAHLTVYGNTKITGKIRCGGVSMVDDLYLDILSPNLTTIYGNLANFNSSIHDAILNNYLTNQTIKDDKGVLIINKYSGIAYMDPSSGKYSSYKSSSESLPVFIATVKNSAGVDQVSSVTTDLSLVTSNFGNYRQVFRQRVDIATQGQIFAGGGYIVPSDKRIKQDIETYDQLVALKQINDLRVTTYKKIDDPLQKIEVGFISQEVKEVIPESVEKLKMYIPDIHKWVPCTYDEETQSITIDNTFNLTFMYRLQVSDENGKKYSAIVTDVEDGKAVINSAEFDTEKPAISKRIFLYGKLVNDFLTLDKNVIFSIAIASIQALSKQVNELTSRLDLLEQKPAPKPRAKRVPKQKSKNA
jgi:hypothetical protein